MLATVYGAWHPLIFLIVWFNKKTDLDNLTIDDWKNIQERAVSFAANVCQSYDNYISREFANQVRSEV